MRLSEHWLREWLPQLTQSAEQIGERLTMAGLELDGIEDAAPVFSGVVVGHIHSVEPHPSADRLKVCHVKAEGQTSYQVICGAPNARDGLFVPFAPVGAVLPNDVLIQEADFRGVKSQGMLCSAAELGLAEQSDGLMELSDDLEPGLDFRQVLDLDDKILEVDLTPNRADCLSVLGVARELSA
ncbi:YtpR family tRNA-binding protein, partial [Acidihalobacter prosperus]